MGEKSMHLVGLKPATFLSQASTLTTTTPLYQELMSSEAVKEHLTLDHWLSQEHPYKEFYVGYSAIPIGKSLKWQMNR